MFGSVSSGPSTPLCFVSVACRSLRPHVVEIGTRRLNILNDVIQRRVPFDGSFDVAAGFVQRHLLLRRQQAAIAVIFESKQHKEMTLRQIFLQVLRHATLDGAPLNECFGHIGIGLETLKDFLPLTGR